MTMIAMMTTMIAMTTAMTMTATTMTMTPCGQVTNGHTAADDIIGLF